MNNEVFDLLVEFHGGLVRIKLSDATIGQCRKSLVGGEKFASQNIQRRCDSLSGWLKELTEWDGSDKATVYAGHSIRKPSIEVFAATFDHLYRDISINQACVKHGVNYQTVKSLKPRIKRWDDFALRLKDLL